MPNAFSRETLQKFEDASASIPLRPLDRAFAAAGIRLGKDTGGAEGARRVQFRRYVAGVDQRDPRQLERLGAALGALIAEVATSKQAFLVSAAERDGFTFADGVFRPARSRPDDPVRDAAQRVKAAARELSAAVDDLLDAVASSKKNVR